MRYLFFLLFVCPLLWGCSAGTGAEKTPYVLLEGETMGTFYRISYAEPRGQNFKPQVDSLLLAINDEVSTYIPTSTISRFNQARDSFILQSSPMSSDSREHRDRHFLVNYLRAAELNKETRGAFDPTVMPLVNYWGFGYTGEKPINGVDSAAVDSLLELVGLPKIELVLKDQYVMIKNRPGIKLDFSALAKGYGVDQVGLLLERMGVQDYLVEIGGEVLARGRNSRGKTWRIGINLPREGVSATEIQAVMPLKDRAMATSGNYRNYYEIAGVKYSHTINPTTGYPERNTLLSASVLADDCLTADAYATAFMVMGPARAMALAEASPELDAYLIVGDEEGQMRVQYTSGLENLIEKPK